MALCLCLSVGFGTSLGIHHSIHHRAESAHHWTLDHLHSAGLHQLGLLLHGHSLSHCVGTLLGQSLPLSHHHTYWCSRSAVGWHSTYLTKGTCIALRTHAHRGHRALLLRWWLFLCGHLGSCLALVSLCLACMSYASKRTFKLCSKTTWRSIETP